MTAAILRRHSRLGESRSNGFLFGWIQAGNDARDNGFSLIEMLLSVSIISLLAGLSLPIYNSFTARNDLSLTTQNVATMIRRAEVYARGNQDDSQWGVNFAASAVTLFKGASYATRISGFDETITIPSTITLSYSGDIVMAKLTGIPSATPTITLTSSITSDNKTVSVNAKGMVSD